jgi:predicted dienelactone hydrolase
MSKLRLKSLLFAILALFASPAPAADFDPVLRDMAGLQLAMWEWGQADAKKPLILYSHGFNGCNNQALFLGSALAQAGYIFVGPNHRDAGCPTTFDPVSRPQQPWDRPDLWTEAVYADRVDDFRKLLVALRADNYWGPRIDFDRVGFVGHSLGGYTALGVAGAWPNWRIPEIRAVVAAAPWVSPYMDRDPFKNILIPIMYQVAADDPGFTPKVVDPEKGAFARMGTAAYLVSFDKARHLSWTTQDATAHPLIIRYTQAFFDTTLKGQPDAGLYETANGVSQLENNIARLKEKNEESTGHLRGKMDRFIEMYDGGQVTPIAPGAPANVAPPPDGAEPPPQN